MLLKKKQYRLHIGKVVYCLVLLRDLYSIEYKVIGRALTIEGLLYEGKRGKELL